MILVPNPGISGRGGMCCFACYFTYCLFPLRRAAVALTICANTAATRPMQRELVCATSNHVR